MMIDCYDLFEFVSPADRSIVMRILDEATDNIVKNKLLDDEDIENHLNDMDRFANALSVQSKYKCPDDPRDEPSANQ